MDTFGDFVEGEEFSLSLPSSWKDLTPVGGNVIEVYLPATDFPLPPDAWAGFLVLQSDLTGVNSVMSLCKFIGTSDATVSKELSAKFNRKVGWLHFCPSRTCIELDDRIRLHVTQVRWWTVENFTADYYTPAMKRQVRKWLEKADGDPPQPAVVGALPKSSPPVPPKGIFSGLGSEATDFKIPGLDPPDFLPEPEELTEAEKSELAQREAARRAGGEALPTDREKLRQRLKDLRERVVPGAGGLPKRTESIPLGTGSGALPTPAPFDAWGSTAMTAGAMLPPVGQAGSPALALEGTRGSTSTSSKDPAKALLLQAYKVADWKKALKKEKRKAGKSGKSGNKAIDALVNVLKQGKKKKKKKKGKKKAGPPGGGPSSSSSPGTSKSSRPGRETKKRKLVTMPDGTTCSVSASDSSGTNSEDSESTDLEAPLLKKSRRRPGSVLELLVSHVQSQLAQDSVLDLGPDTSAMTSGVKITTYFSLHLRQQHPHAVNQHRELYCLARALDLIRAGQIAQGADLLSGRFMAIHQSLNDNSWSTAMHMELAPLEEAQAASPSLVLATRRHSKLYQRMQGDRFQSGGGSFGKGKGRRAWSSWQPEDRGDGSAKGKGKTGKGKGKGNYGKGGGKNNNSWSQNLEKVEEKTPPK